MEALLQTIRLALLNGFAHDFPKFTAMIKRLEQTAPDMFAKLFAYNEFQIVADDAEVKLAVMSTDTHANTKTLVRVKANVYKALGFPVREGDMSPLFEQMLRKAYWVDWDKSAVIITSNMALKWWKEVAFDDRSVF